MQSVDPSKRPGVGPEGYVALKNHPFFRKIDWKNLRNQSPPKLAKEHQAHGHFNAADNSQESWNHGHAGDGSTNPNDVNSGATSSVELMSHITRLASIDSFDSKWQQFLEPSESILMISMVRKMQKLSSKKVQLILTDKPKLIYVDPSKLVMKGNIIWSDNPSEFNIQVSTPSNFKICTPKKIMTFEDPKQRAGQWKKAIEGLQKR